MSRNLLVAKHQSVVWSWMPETGGVEWRSSRTNMINPYYNFASKTSIHTHTHTQWLWRRPACTDRQRCVICDLTDSNPLPEPGFYALLKSLHHPEHFIIHKGEAVCGGGSCGHHCGGALSVRMKGVVDTKQAASQPTDNICVGFCQQRLFW